MNWKRIALELFFQRYGKRCILCSKIVHLIKDSHFEMKYDQCYLMHKKCKAKEDSE